jgi:hypothetical protein
MACRRTDAAHEQNSANEHMEDQDFHDRPAPAVFSITPSCRPLSNVGASVTKYLAAIVLVSVQERSTLAIGREV